jgi:hypothetical protein
MAGQIGDGNGAFGLGNGDPRGRGHERLVAESHHHDVMASPLGFRDAGAKRGSEARRPLAVVDDHLLREHFAEVYRTHHHDDLVELRPADVTERPCDQRSASKRGQEFVADVDETSRPSGAKQYARGHARA